MVATTRLNTKDARDYIITVRDTFKDNREIYDTFLNVMWDLKFKRICRSCVRSKIKDLFRGHQKLIMDFNKFLPPECYKLTFEGDQTPLKMPEYREAAYFISKVKARLQDDRAFKSFVEILNMHKKNEKSITDVYHEVFNALRDHHDLREEFVYFLPRDREW